MKFIPLRIALASNLVFSLFCAGQMFFASDEVAAQLGNVPVWIVMIISLGLFAFAGLVLTVIRNLRIGEALIISALDLLWVVLTVPLVAVPGLLSETGQGLVLAVAAAVGLFGMAQLWAIRAALATGVATRGSYRHCVRLESMRSPDALWAVIRDLGQIQRYSAGLSASRLEGADEPGTGALRVCTDQKGQTWAEEVTSFDDAGRNVVLKFRTDDPAFPFPFAQMIGGWSVGPGEEGGSCVEVWWSVRPKMTWFGWLLVALMTIPLDRDIRRIVAAMEVGGQEALGRRTGALPALGYC